MARKICYELLDIEEKQHQKNIKLGLLKNLEITQNNKITGWSLKQLPIKFTNLMDLREISKILVRFLPLDPWLPRCIKNLAKPCHGIQDASRKVNPFLLMYYN